jgi:hypothetical protein
VAQSFRYTFKITIRDYPNEKETESYTRINIVQIVLQALRAGDTDTKLILPPDTTTQQRSYSTNKSYLKKINENKKIEELLQIHNNGNILGDLFTSNSKYSTIKKHQETKKVLQDKFKIITNLNNIEAATLQK